MGKKRERRLLCLPVEAFRGVSGKGRPPGVSILPVDHKLCKVGISREHPDQHFPWRSSTAYALFKPRLTIDKLFTVEYTKVHIRKYSVFQFRL